MNRTIDWLAALLVVFWLSTGVSNSAEESRWNSKRSFDNKPMQSNPQNRSYTRQTPDQLRAAVRNQNNRQSLALKGGVVSKIGEFALGGGFGVILFGGDFENLNLFDFVIFGLLAIIFYPLYARRKLIKIKENRDANSHRKF